MYPNIPEIDHKWNGQHPVNFLSKPEIKQVLHTRKENIKTETTTVQYYAE